MDTQFNGSKQSIVKRLSGTHVVEHSLARHGEPYGIFYRRHVNTLGAITGKRA